MKDRWRDSEANHFIKTHGLIGQEDLALLAYATRLVGRVPDLAMHGGGNTSCKGIFKTIRNDEIPALFIKPSGADMGMVSPADFIAMDLVCLKRLSSVRSLSDEKITAEFRQHMLRYSDYLPSIETPLHAFLEKKFIIHTHPSAILALSNRISGEKTVLKALGDEVGFIPYVSLGLNLGHSAASEMVKKKEPPAIVLAQHGLVTWGESAKEAYKKTIEFVSRAEDYLRKTKRFTVAVKSKTSVYAASKRYKKYAPLLTELLSPHSITLAPLISKEALDLLEGPKAREIFCTEPLNPDHLLRTKIRPVFVENPDYENQDSLRRQIAGGIKSYSFDYAAYIKKRSKQMKGLKPSASDFLPRVVLLPGLGAVCAASDLETANIFRDITRQALNVKRVIYETGGTYLGLAEDDAFEMELRVWRKQQLHPK
jgi:rhamnose utilization protein RhaD (predicted bifunctional aldolase and dehydrogenase)